MLEEFRDFINRGNVIDLAVAVVLGIAFGAVTLSFTNDILLQIIAIFGGEPNFDQLTIDISDTPIYYGRFLTAVVNFVIVAFAMFLVVKAINAMQTLGKSDGEEEAAEPTEVELLTEIRDLLRPRG